MAVMYPRRHRGVKRLSQANLVLALLLLAFVLAVA